ncbi:hypothetical protein SASPL_157576 [Salvia splendens]|uniref:Uncharacterized protein n=1 Tax=Salvia splendens TaxID=180675 RepID=A0A8X8VUP5_SALSN|nr:hypothetical protein SASPL_157576 [Salvia splendens]
MFQQGWRRHHLLPFSAAASWDTRSPRLCPLRPALVRVLLSPSSTKKLSSLLNALFYNLSKCFKIQEFGRSVYWLCWDEKGALLRAVVDHSVGKDLPPVSVERFENLPGRGLFATISSAEPGFEGGKPLKASIGSVEYITSLFTSNDESRKVKEAVNTSSYGGDFVRAALSVNNKINPRADSLDVINTLQNEGNLRVMMLTGDHELSARRVADAVGIKEFHCSLKPEDKLYHVTKFLEIRVFTISTLTRIQYGYLTVVYMLEGGGLIMVGDGINDAPALAAATVGIVLAERASATAIAVADVLLLQDNISGVPFIVAKSRQTTSLVKQNVALALSSIFLASLTSVLGFIPLWLTVLLHEGGTLLVCLNSIRALNAPTWSWKHDLLQLIHKFKSLLRFNFDHGTIQPTLL